jgi:hypothetical protein
MLTKSIILTKQLYSQIIKRHIVIKHEYINSCSNCIFFIKPTFRYPEVQSTFHGKCKQFGEKNIITGEIEQYNALKCRVDKSLCGIEAKHFIYNFGQK